MTPPGWRERLRSGPAKDRTVWLGSFVLLFGLAALWAAVIPLGGQPDESAHTSKAAAVVRGQFTWLSRTPVKGTGGADPTRVDMEIDVPRGYADLTDVSFCIARPPRLDASCSPPVDNDTTLVRTNDYVAAYPPLPYLIFGWPTLWFKPSQALYLMRLANAAACAALFASALVAARRIDRSGLTIVGTALAATPSAIFFASAPNPNGLEIASAICLSVAMIEVLRAPRPGEAAIAWRSITRVVVAASVLALSRPASLAVLALVVGTTVSAFATHTRLAQLWRERSARIGASVVALASAAGFGWFVYARPLETIVGIPFPGLSTRRAAEISWSRLPRIAREAVGVFGWGETWPPGWVHYGWLALVAALVVAALALGSWRHRVVLAALVIVNVAIPLAAEIPKAPELGFIWQGRYTLPFAVAIPIVAAWTLALSNRVPRSVSTPAILVSCVFIATALLASLAVTLTRFATGRLTPLFGYLDNAPWHPRIPPGMVLVLSVSAVVAYGTWLAWLALRPTPTARSSPEEGPRSVVGTPQALG